MANAGDEEVKTLFLSGLPDDIKEREIYNLFRIHKGYESCQLKYSGRGYQIVAFAVFTDQQSALAAKEALNGLKFDPQTGATLHIELARANSRTKRSRSEDSGLGALEKKYRGPVGTPGAYPDPGVAGTVHLPGMVHSVYNDMSGFPPPQSGGMVGPPLYTGQEGLSSMMLGPSLIPPPPAPGSNPPCSTLFIANLGQTCTEEELIQVLSRFPGYRKIKMQIKGGLPVAFVEFQDVMCSTQALSQLQNSMLASSDRGGMRLEYAKAKMGQPRRERLSSTHL
ncbi:RNA-binding protein with multiple splicing [Marchantia polymorpha subsp. ruderalis]|uniref:RRM domain-containing protein n=1 Tax=Marchantia polymorpha TaxID=3197 RepID=A0A2R6W141_MARPO|nr:hypothetical protein MARPO_0192s0008 [Marchantia polymorpha]BBN20367.1 hypothetical protein Mp_8g18530 [Marchantia polymorpha subsp. ruderalis]|eukprot:PTQ27573.1 hypothetical protein MARPO_0192s0008 [Marchantia polymorpha]